MKSQWGENKFRITDFFKGESKASFFYLGIFSGDGPILAIRLISLEKQGLGFLELPGGTEIETKVGLGEGHGLVVGGEVRFEDRKGWEMEE